MSAAVGLWKSRFPVLSPVVLGSQPQRNHPVRCPVGARWLSRTRTGT